ncbi:BglG family transcription antiterminator [Halobacillus salinus]|uniref:Transcription antiterminator n=1 Tax=Halobacillus salinus TaxID=192814 RepID=A0A4Z0H1F2_9BACI|nr:BglG family transcription antiterminator [Halobacillus salinus]TGB03950.1 transcription antiterminator [Halobacillus salinus]
MYVSARERKMIEYLLDARDAVPVKTLAEELGVSSRTIHRDLNGLESTLQDFQVALKKQSGKGIALMGDDKSVASLKEGLRQQGTFDYTPEERKVLILSWLLEAKEPMKIVALAAELGVTVATASHDLDQIENDLLSFDLQLVRRRGYGVEVTGKEVNIREAIQHIMMRHMNDYDFLRLMRQHISQSPVQTQWDAVSEHLLGLVSKERIHTIEHVVETFRSELTYPLADSAYIGLVIHLALAMERIKQGERIQIESEYLDDLRETKEFQVASRMIEELEKQLELSIPEAEIGYITMHLMGAKSRYNKDSVMEESSLSIAFHAKQLIEFVSNSLQKDLHHSEKLLNDLVIHLKPSLYRIQQGMDIHNPLTKQIEEDYPELSEIVGQAVRHVFPDLTFPKEEAAFLVMHFASALLNLEETKRLHVLVVCSSGIGTAKILAAKLKRQFSEIETVDHQSLFDLKHLQVEEYDLVVSTIPIDQLEDYVLVNPMLSTGDIHQVEHRIRKVRIRGSLKRTASKEMKVQDQTLQSIRNSVSAVQKYVQTISHLLNGLHVFQAKADSKSDIIQETCEYLAKRHALEHPESVGQALLEREAAGGLGVPQTGIALFHTRSEYTKKPSFSIVPLKEPLALQSMEGSMMEVNAFVVLLAPHDLSQEGLEVVSFLSTLFIEEPKSVQVVHQGTKEEIIEYVSNQLHRLMKEKISS